jgi:hypothetical protein
VLKPFDGLILNGEPSGVVDSAFGIVTVLTLQSKDPLLQARIVGAEALYQFLAFVHTGAGDDRATRDHDQREDRRLPGPK